MKNKGVLTDIGYLFLLLELGICCGFLVWSAQDKILHFLVFILVLICMLVSRLTMPSVGFLINALLFFLYFTWLIFQPSDTAKGDNQLFFWLILSPLLTFTGEAMFLPVKHMERERQHLRNRLALEGYEDTMTGLKNNRAFSMEVPVFQKLAERYETGLTFVLCRFRFEKELHKIIGTKQVNEAAVFIAREMEKTFRTEDCLYVISTEPWSFGLLMLAKEGSRERILQRLKAIFPAVEQKEFTGQHTPRLEMRIGIYETKGNKETAEELVKNAETRMQYDV